MSRTPRKVRRLFEIRNCFDAARSFEKLQLLEQIADGEIRSASTLRHLHSALCFVRAFPDTAKHYQLAQSQLRSFHERLAGVPANAQHGFWDTGIAGTPIHYRFSFKVAAWLAQRVRGSVAIDWDDTDDTTRLDELLERILLPSESDFFSSGEVTSRDWLDLARTGDAGTEFDWLLKQLRDPRRAATWSQLYDAADLPLAWELQDSGYSTSRNEFPINTIRTRGRGMRERIANVKKEILRPVQSSRVLSRRAGSQLIDVAMASLAVRHRETFHFNHASPAEVTIADVGEGVAVAVFGLLPEHRYPLECTMGFLILSNGVPIGYGGSSIVFSQVNTGINIFDEYRGSEAAYLWIQVMRVYHHIAGCTRFIADAYQIGNDNDEALQSGAFWFYYRLGYRPILPEIRKLALREANRIKRDRRHRSSLATLRRLASCDMHLTLPGARQSELFDERRLEISSLLATKELAAAGGDSRAVSRRRVATRLLRDLNIRNFGRWSKSRRDAFYVIAPIVLAAKPATWSREDKRSMRKLLFLKGGPREADYARLLSRQDHFLAALRAECRGEL